MGYLDDRLDQLQQGADDLAAGDEIRRTNQLLEVLVQAIVEDPESYWRDGFSSTPPGESDTGQGAPEYDSYVNLTATSDMKRLSLGVTADMVAVRHVPDEVEIHFADPEKRDNTAIIVESQDSPFVFSGVYGLGATNAWFTKGPNAGSDFEFDLVAVTRSGGEK